MENDQQMMLAELKRLKMLRQISEDLTSSLRTSEIRTKVMEAAASALESETATLYLYDGASNELSFETVLGVAGNQLKNLRIPANEKSIAGSCALNRKPEIINDVQSDSRHFRKADSATRFVTRNMMVTPVLYQGTLRGVLQVLNKISGHFRLQDLELLNDISKTVALALENAILYESLRSQFHQTIEAMALAIEKRDKYTGGHTKRVTYFSTHIAKAMRLTEDDIEQLRLSAIIHDIGKIGVEDAVLNKPAPLNDHEFATMKTHAEIGYQILKDIQAMEGLLGGVRGHHERYDGKGYPLGLKGDSIPLFGRIIAVADTFDAMISHRPYRNGLPLSVACEEIVRHQGTQFDPSVVEGFLKAYQDGDFPGFAERQIGPPPHKKEAA